MTGANATFQASRLVETNGKETYAEFGSPFLGYVEPIAPTPEAMITGEAVYDRVKIFVDGLIDLKIGDKLTGDGDMKVVGVMPFRGGDIPSHTEIIALRS